MFDFGFSEVLLIFVIALVVLGPEKLPRLASQVGRWVGRARAMARQFREQLEEEVNLEQVRKAHNAPPPKTETETQTGTGTEQPTAQSASTAPTEESSTAGPSPSHYVQPASTPIGGDAPLMPDPVDFRADTFSHAHPTNEYGANPHTANGAAESAPVHSGTDAPVPTQTPAKVADGGSSTSEGEPTHTPGAASGAYAETNAPAPADGTKHS